MDTPTTILLRDSRPFTTQAQTHQAIYELIYQQISAHQPLYGDFVVATARLTPVPPHRVTNMYKLGYDYTKWWSEMERYSRARANVHHGLGNHLQGVVAGFEMIDESLASA